MRPVVVEVSHVLAERPPPLRLADLRTEAYTPFIPLTHPRLNVMLDGLAPWGAIAERTGVLPQARYDALVAEVRALHRDPAYGNHLARLAALIGVGLEKLSPPTKQSRRYLSRLPWPRHWRAGHTQHRADLAT